MSPKSKVQSPESAEAATDRPSVSSPPTEHATRNTFHVSRFTFHASRYLSIYLALWKNSVAREMMFKSNFLLWIVVELLWFGLLLSFIGVLYFHIVHIGN